MHRLGPGAQLVSATAAPRRCGCSSPRRSATRGSTCSGSTSTSTSASAGAASELAEQIGDYDGILIRSATKLDAELLERATRLRAVGRAGVGVDNVDVAGGDQARHRRRQRAAVERDHGRRAHDGAAAGAGAQRPAGARLADQRASGSARSSPASSCTRRRSGSSASAGSGSSSPSARAGSGCRWSPTTRT